MEEQVCGGRSKCRNCRHVIPWHDNIPLVSFSLLGGKCRFCRSTISWIYPAVEFATGLLFFALAARFGWTVQAILYAILGSGLLVVSVIDAKTMMIPDRVSLPGLGVGVVSSFFFPMLHGAAHPWGGLWASLLGALVGGGFVYGMGLVGGILFRRRLAAIGEEEAMGFGDVKLMAMVGSFIGWQKVLLVNLFLAPLIGSVIGVVAKFRYHRDLIPYGPFLAIGTLCAIFWGNQVIHWYQGLFF